MLDPDLIDGEVLDDLLSRLEVNEDDDDSVETGMNRIKAMSVQNAFEAYLNWNGIFGHTDQFIKALDSLREAEAGTADIQVPCNHENARPTQNQFGNLLNVYHDCEKVVAVKEVKERCNNGGREG